uniref:Uncharacterized protein n=1 Tax=Oryza meridionalis TaxID=40149 RepID=A0A0E0D399_9ORYZ
MGGPLNAAGGDGGAKAVEPLRPPSPPDPKTMARWYQLEALERAVRGNTLAFLETGSGKTLIAVMLLRAYAHRVRRPDSRRFAVFLVPTVVLVGQQARVVEQHTDLVVKQFYGDMGVDFWDAATWRSQLEDGEVLVMTPQILLDNLRHSFFRLQDIALLIFDECHHARGNTPYACIFKEFYHPQLNSSASDPLPRIFGMSASLIYSKDLNQHNYSKQISEIENLMNSKVYTVDSESALSEYIPFASTKIVHFDDSNISSELHANILSCLNRLTKKVNSAFYCSVTCCLPTSCLLYCMKAAEVQSYEENSLSFWGETLDKNVEGFIRNYSEEVHRELSCFLKNGHIGENFPADSQDGILTPKVHCLIRTLLQYSFFLNFTFYFHSRITGFYRLVLRWILKCKHMQDLRCIVFVQRVITSIVLEPLLSSIHEMSGWNVKHMAGSRPGLLSQSRKNHTEIVESFRKGKVHIIIATQILEEGLDVPSCNLVIRFDPSATNQRGDVEAHTNAEKFLASGQIMREESLRLGSISCQPLENTLYFKPLPRFDIDKASGTCTLHLPKSSPVQTVNVEGEGSILKETVCLKACQELHAIGALTDSLLPELDVPCDEEPDISGQDNASVTMKYVGIIHLNQEQVIIARRFQTTILSFLIGDDHLEVSNGIKYFHEMQVPIGVVYLLLPLVSGRIDWCSMKFSSSPIYEANNKHMTHCHSCKDIDLLQTKDGPFCSGFLDLDANSRLPQHDGTVVTYKDYFKTRHGLTLTFENQPLLAGSKHVKVRNFFHNCYSKKEKEPGDRYSVELPPELCRIIMSPVSANNLHIFSYVPSIMFRIQCMLLSVKLKVQLGPTVQQFDVPVLKGYIHAEEFNPKDWIIPCLDYHERGNKKVSFLAPNGMYSQRKMSIKSKRIADSVEALIGAYLSTAGEKAAFLLMKSLGMNIEFHTEIPVERKISMKAEEFINVRSLEGMLGYKFNDSLLLLEALTHGSYQTSGPTSCYQRLEFLGDAILDHLFTEYYYSKYPDCTPELLTDLRSASVNNNCYAHAAVKSGLNKHILHSSSELHRKMSYYLEKFGQSFTGPSYGWEAGIGLPKVLGDVIESIAGAIYLDSKCDKEVVWRSMKRLLEPLATPETIEPDPVKGLQEFCDRRSFKITYEKNHVDGVSSVIARVKAGETTYSATKSGPSKLVAKKLASKAVLKDLIAGHKDTEAAAVS